MFRAYFNRQGIMKEKGHSHRNTKKFDLVGINLLDFRDIK